MIIISSSINNNNSSSSSNTTTRSSSLGSLILRALPRQALYINCSSIRTRSPLSTSSIAGLMSITPHHYHHLPLIPLILIILIMTLITLILILCLVLWVAPSVIFNDRFSSSSYLIFPHLMRFLLFVSFNTPNLQSFILGV
jgi:hypothetical protein